MLTTELKLINASQRADEIVCGLPIPDYVLNYQPNYTDPDLLRCALSELPTIGSVTSPRLVDQLRARLASIATNESNEAMIIAGRCAEPVDRGTVEAMSSEVMVVRNIAIGALGNVLYFARCAGQNAKPRQEEYERLANGMRVPSYMGDMINGQRYDQRIPDPRRMVHAARQAVALESKTRKAAGKHVPTAHEALLLAYEMAYMRTDRETERQYLLSTDMPWVGYRTNDPNGEHVKLLAGIENPVGVKIGAKNTPDDIKALAEKLNPEKSSGKITFMIRLDLSHYDDNLTQLLEAIKEHAPGALIMYDIHGATKKRPDGTKIRHVGSIVVGISRLSDACARVGLQMNGAHLEVIGEDRYECVDEPDHMPIHPGGIDPQLNLGQTRDILKGIRPKLSQAA